MWFPTYSSQGLTMSPHCAQMMGEDMSSLPDTFLTIGHISGRWQESMPQERWLQGLLAGGGYTSKAGFSLLGSCPEVSLCRSTVISVVKVWK